MNFIKYLSLISLVLLFLNCDRELSITKFKDEYDQYDSELRIEAIFNTTNMKKSIVRIDSTILVTDTTLFSEKEDDANNEISQPDEIEETLSQIHARNLDVTLHNYSKGQKVIDFTWTPNAKRVKYGNKNRKEFSYGAYIPDTIYIDSINYNQQYKFHVTGESDTIVGEFSPSPPAEFYYPDSANIAKQNDTLIFNNRKNNVIKWKADANQRVGIVSLYRIYNNNKSEILFTYPQTRNADEQESETPWQGEYPIDQALPPGLYKFEIGLPSQGYGHYFYSSLPIDDKELNNFRDQNGEIVLGIAGSMAFAEQYFRITE